MVPRIGQPQQPPPQQYRPQPQRAQQYPPQRPQQYQPQQQQYAPPQQPAPRPAPEPPAPRQPRQRSANPMHIPGLGCLKGCLFTVVLLIVAGWLIWELTPLQGWIDEGKGYWEAIGDGISKVTGWFDGLGGSSGG